MVLAGVAFATIAAAQEPGQVHDVRVGDRLVPPREYGHSDGPIDPSRHDPIESGRIYDLAYAGIVKGQVRFERRGYSIDDLHNPGFSQFQDWPLDTRSLVISDIALTLVEVRADGLRYSWSYLKGGGEPGPDPSIADSDPGIAIAIKER